MKGMEGEAEDVLEGSDDERRENSVSVCGGAE